MAARRGRTLTGAAGWGPKARKCHRGVTTRPRGGLCRVSQGSPRRERRARIQDRGFRQDVVTDHQRTARRRARAGGSRVARCTGRPVRRHGKRHLRLVRRRCALDAVFAEPAAGACHRPHCTARRPVASTEGRSFWILDDVAAIATSRGVRPVGDAVLLPARNAPLDAGPAPRRMASAAIRRTAPR